MSNNSQIIESFLSNQNLQQHYKFVSEEVRKRIGVDINKYPGTERQFQKMAIVLAKKKQDNNPLLSNLNSDLKNHCTNYFCQHIKQLKLKKQNANNIQTSVEPLPSTNTLNLIDDYNNVKQNMNINNIEASTSYTTYDPQTLIETGKERNMRDENDLTKVLENALLERGQINDVPRNALPNNEEPNILPFNLNDDISNMLSVANPGEDLPLYQNVLELTESNEDLNNKVNNLVKERETLESATEIQDFRKLDRNTQLDLTRKFTTKKGESNMMLERNNTDAETLNARTEIKDQAELYRLNEEGKRRMIERMTNSSISGNDVRTIAPLVDNLLIEKLLSLQRDMQPDYIEKVNYIIINSIDRDWYNNSRETRYNFKVNFRPHRDHLGAGIQDLFRNITSVELVNAILPQDNILIPFDCRPYLDILHYPYLLLQIKEFSDVFRGTNNNNDRAFSVLIFDKQNDSSVLSSDFISGSNSMVNGTPTTQFYKEYRKTFYKYLPAYFEKKIFYNQPLASLGHMTIKLETPAGENINILNDVLTINDIQYTDVLSNLTVIENNFEYDVSHSYPNDSSASTRKYIRLETSSSFSNKLFRLGDNIRIQGYNIQGSGTDNTKFVNFINRQEGHYILNTDLSNLSIGGNQGFTSNIYIAPPGDLNDNLNSLDTTTYYDDTNIDLSNYSTNSNVGKLINGNLQSHFLFKINTREGDVSRVTMPMNV